MTLLRASLVAIALGGCTYVTPKVYEDKIACLDEDGDLAPAKDECDDPALGAEADCDETRNFRFPGNPEIPYDGIDQDCADEDLIDVDGDLWPGVLFQDWEGQHPGVDYPTNLDCDGACDLAAEWDCDDNLVAENDPLVLRKGVHQFPGSLAEVPYDGVDTDCKGDDDWDFDKDGHVPPAALHGGATYTGALPQDDCDDTRQDVYPGPQQGADNLDPRWRDDDVFYDGVDNNCDGVNDYDRDGDDYIQAEHQAAYDEFLDRYQYANMLAPCASDCDDCDDDPTDDGGQVKTAPQINPGASETYYDDLDQNCDDQDDFDQDLDGFSCDGITNVACTGHIGDDCADALPAINPAALEIFDDEIDQDCSGDDAPRFAFGDLEWVDPSTPDIARTNDHFVIAAAASQIEGTLGPAVRAIAIAETDANGSGEYHQSIRFEPVNDDDTDPVGRATALIAGGSVFSNALSAFSFDASPKRTTQRVRRFQWEPNSQIYFEILLTSESYASIDPDPEDETNPDPDPYLDFDVQISPNGEVWGAGCSLDTVHFVVANNDPPRGAAMSRIGTSGTPTTDGGGSVCWLEINSATAGQLHVYSGATYRRFNVTDPVSGPAGMTEAAPTHDTSAVAPIDARHRGPYVVFATAAALGPVAIWDGSTLHDDILEGEGVHSADLAKVGSTFYLAAIVDDTGSDGLNDVMLCTGTAVQTPDETCSVIPYDDPSDGEPTGIALHAEAGMLVLAVSALGTEDAVGWAFLALPAP